MILEISRFMEEASSEELFLLVYKKKNAIFAHGKKLETMKQ